MKLKCPQTARNPPPNNTPRKCQNFSQLAAMFSTHTTSNPNPSPGKRHERGRMVKANQKLKENYPSSDTEREKKTVKIVSPHKKIMQETFQNEPPPPQNLLDCVAVGKICNKENLETIHTNLNKPARPAPAKLFQKATKSSASKANPESQKFSNFGGKNPPNRPTNQQQERTFQVASKSADWIAPKEQQYRPTKPEII